MDGRYLSGYKDFSWFNYIDGTNEETRMERLLVNQYFIFKNYDCKEVWEDTYILSSEQ